MIIKSFADTLTTLAIKNKDIYVVSADLASSLRLLDFKANFPARFIEVGVAEQNGAGIAAGLAKAGKTVFFCTFATFSPGINWGVIRQSICYNQANVKLVGSHAGLLSGDLGTTHQMTEDVALTTTLPHLQVFSPLDSVEVTKILPTIVNSKSPCYLRLTRGQTPDVFSPKSSFTIGKSHILNSGSKITILGYGPILVQALEIIKENPLFSDYLEIINLSSLKPLDKSTILKSINKTKKVIIIEDHQKVGGIGQIIAGLILENNLNSSFIHLGIDDKFGQSSKNISQLWDHYGIGKSDLLSAIKKLLL